MYIPKHLEGTPTAEILTRLYEAAAARNLTVNRDWIPAVRGGAAKWSVRYAARTIASVTIEGLEGKTARSKSYQQIETLLSTVEKSPKWVKLSGLSHAEESLINQIIPETNRFKHDSRGEYRTAVTEDLLAKAEDAIRRCHKWVSLGRDFPRSANVELLDCYAKWTGSEWTVPEPWEKAARQIIARHALVDGETSTSTGDQSKPALAPAEPETIRDESSAFIRVNVTVPFMGGTAPEHTEGDVFLHRMNVEHSSQGQYLMILSVESRPIDEDNDDFEETFIAHCRPATETEIAAQAEKDAAEAAEQAEKARREAEKKAAQEAEGERLLAARRRDQEVWDRKMAQYEAHWQSIDWSRFTPAPPINEVTPLKYPGLFNPEREGYLQLLDRRTMEWSRRMKPILGGYRVMIATDAAGREWLYSEGHGILTEEMMTLPPVWTVTLLDHWGNYPEPSGLRNTIHYLGLEDRYEDAFQALCQLSTALGLRYETHDSWFPMQFDLTPEGRIVFAVNYKRHEQDITDLIPALLDGNEDGIEEARAGLAEMERLRVERAEVQRREKKRKDVQKRYRRTDLESVVAERIWYTENTLGRSGDAQSIERVLAETTKGETVEFYAAVETWWSWGEDADAGEHVTVFPSESAARAFLAKQK